MRQKKDTKWKALRITGRPGLLVRLEASHRGKGSCRTGQRGLERRHLKRAEQVTVSLFLTLAIGMAVALTLDLALTLALDLGLAAKP